MEELATILFFALVLIIPFLPQVVGFISYKLLRRHHDLVAHIVGVVIPPVSFFYGFLRFSGVEFSSQSNGTILLLLVSFLQLFFSLLIQLAIHNRHKFNESQLP